MQDHVKNLILFSLSAGAFMAFNELIVLPYQIPSDWWDFYEKSHGPAYMGLLHLGPSVALFSAGAWYGISLISFEDYENAPKEQRAVQGGDTLELG